MGIFEPFNSVVIRSPLVSYSTGLRAIESIDNLKQFFTDPVYGESLLVASPSLYNDFIKWKTGQLDNKKTQDKIVLSLVKYAIRMSTRSTPFGLFAGLSTCEIGKDSTVNFGPLQKNTKQAKYDMSILFRVYDKLFQSSEIRKKLRYYINSSLYQVNSVYRYTEFQLSKKKATYNTVDVKVSLLLSKLMEVAEKGASYTQLLLTLTGLGQGLDASTKYLDQIIDSQILVPQIYPTEIGRDYIYYLRDVIKKNNSFQAMKYATLLSELIDILEDIGSQPIGESFLTFERARSTLEKFDFDKIPGTIFSFDLLKPVNYAKISSETINRVLDVCETLSKLGTRDYAPHLEKFKERFESRFGEREVPLLSALDVDMGIGFAENISGGKTPLLLDIDFRNKSNSGKNIQLNNFTKYILERYLGWTDGSYSELKLTKDQLKPFFNKDANVTASCPHTGTVQMSLVGKDVNNKDKIYFNALMGYSALSLLGRFGSLSKGISKLCDEISIYEDSQYPNSISAEIVHLSRNDDRLGNITRRNNLWSKEIIYLGNSESHISDRIYPKDILVSVRDEKVYLRSGKTGKNIIPKLSNAQNFHNSTLPVFHFLCLLQEQEGIKHVGFSWGQLSELFNEFPRVSIDDVIVSPHIWILDKSKLRNLQNRKIKPTNEEINVWRKQFNINDKVVLADGDNELLIDFSNELSTMAFWDSIKQKDKIELYEYLFDEVSVPSWGPDGGYCNEFLISVKNRAKTSQKLIDLTNDPFEHDVLPYKYVPGSQWIYFKLYIGEYSSNELISDYLLPLAGELLEKGLIDHWFFIRYTDPHHHIRFRLKVNKNNGDIVSQVNEYFKDLIEHDLLWKVQVDTYFPELARYGQHTIEYVETIFYHDSVATAHMIKAIKGFSDNQISILAMYSLDQLLSDFGLSGSEKHQFTMSVNEGYTSEVEKDKSFKVSVDKQYRTLRDIIGERLDMSIDNDLINILQKRSSSVQVLASKIGQMHSSERYMQILQSICHMHLNRFFNAKPRQQEIVVYELLERHVRSTIARQKANNTISLNSIKKQ